MRALFQRILCKSKGEKITIIPIGDTHLGAKNVDKEKLKGLIKYVKDTPGVYWVGMGDYIDAINYSDKRFNAASTEDIADLDDLVNTQVGKFVAMFNPIANRCLGLLDGNHEETVRKRYHQDTVAQICRKMHVQRLTYSCLMRIYFDHNRRSCRGSRSIVLYAHHGHGASRTIGGRLNNVLNKSRGIDADVFIMGHCHLKANVDGERLYISQNRGGEAFVYSRKQLFATTGSFMYAMGEGYNTYSEIAGYDPIPTGFIKIHIEPYKQVVVDKSDGKRHCRDLYPHIHMSV